MLTTVEYEASQVASFVPNVVSYSRSLTSGHSPADERYSRWLYVAENFFSSFFCCRFCLLASKGHSGFCLSHARFVQHRVNVTLVKFKMSSKVVN